MLLAVSGGVLALVVRAYDTTVAKREVDALRAAIHAHQDTMMHDVAMVLEQAMELHNLGGGSYADVHAHLGRKLTAGFGLEYVYLTDADGNVLYASENGELGVQQVAQALRPALLKLIQGLKSLEPGATNLGVAVGAGKRVMLIARVFDQRSSAQNRSQPVIAVVADALDAGLLSSFAEPAKLDALTLAPKGHGAVTAVHAVADAGGELELPNLYDGAQVVLSWRSRRPGEHLLLAAMPVVLAAALVLCAIFFVMMVRARRLAAALSESEARARRLANEDQLTGLATRGHFLALLEAALRARREDGRVALVFVDLDGFKAVNDTNGHAAGDELLRVIGRRLRSCVGERGVVARIGGDEFVLFVSYESEPEFLSLVASLYGVLDIPVELDGVELRAGASMGAARAPQDATTISELMRLADIALYRAKADGGGIFREFVPALEQAHMQRQRIELELALALERGELTVLYQPQVDVETERVVGFEALVRWDHPTRGRVLPGEFVPIAERSRLITRLDAFVLRRACTEARALPGVTLSVNLSPLNLRAAGFADDVEATLKEAGFDPHRLEFELTEGAIIDAGEETRQALNRLREHGVRFALDDFGTGHASLVHIRRFPITKIKIDRFFILNLGVQREAASIVEYVVRLARSLGVIVTAEGVETREQLRFLRAFGAHQGQGYLFAPPLPLEAAIAMLERQRAGESALSAWHDGDDEASDGLQPTT